MPQRKQLWWEFLMNRARIIPKTPSKNPSHQLRNVVGRFCQKHYATMQSMISIRKYRCEPKHIKQIYQLRMITQHQSGDLHALAYFNVVLSLCVSQAMMAFGPVRIGSFIEQRSTSTNIRWSFMKLAKNLHLKNWSDSIIPATFVYGPPKKHLLIMFYIICPHSISVAYSN